MTRIPFWAQASYWLAIAGLVTGVVAALAGFVDFVSRPQIRRLSIAWLHFLGNGAAMVLTIVNIVLRRADPAAAISGAELALSVLVVLILLVTGWLGGEMVFRHRVGVMGPVSEPAPARSHADPEGIRAARR